MASVASLDQTNQAEEKTAPQDIRIAWIAPSLDRGWRWQPFLKEFSKICPNTVVFTGFWSGFTRGFEGAFKIQKIPGYKQVGYSASDMGYPKGFMWASPQLFADLLRFRPEIIITNGFHLCTAYALLVKWVLHSRLILLWQGVSPETGGTAGTLRLKLRKMLGRAFDLAICNTQEGVRYLEDVVGMPSEKVRQFVGEVADRESFSLENKEENFLERDRRPIFLFVGRLIRGKGVDRLLEACALLVQRGIDNFSVVLVGNGGHRIEFLELVRKLGIECQVRWEGFVSYENLGPYYNACDVFILPSIEDTWGVVVLEAMCFGKPVLCSRYAGSSEMVRHGTNGYVFDPCNPEELADYMMQFIRKPELTTKYGAASKEIMAHLTHKHAAAALSRILLDAPGS